MFDAELMGQLREVFASLTHEVELVYAPSSHADQAELVAMLEALAQASPKLRVRLSAPADGRQARVPTFHLERAGAPVGIAFRGIPGGHELSSLVLALLNTDGKGKLPAEALTSRVRRLKGAPKVSTYVSLTCENCPDVVQALNQLALAHPSFTHEMVDGAYVPEEIAALGIQGVPAVVVDGKLIHSGRATVLDLVSKLEETFGVTEGESTQGARELGHYDVVVVGGGPAGASAAIYSVRKGLKTALLAEKSGGQVQETRGIENLISVPYTEGPQLAAALSQHVAAYPIEVLEHRRVKTLTQGAKKRLELDSGERLTADAVIVATGAKWRELGVPGEKEYLGRGVAFCPHCDGPFYKGKKVAVIGGGNSGVEAAIDLAGIVREVVLLEFADSLKADKILTDKLATMPNVSVITSAKTQAIQGDGQKVTSLSYEERKTGAAKSLTLDGVFVQIGLVPNSQFVKGVVELTPFGEIVVDAKGHTSVPGIYAAGDVTTTPFKQIIIAMGEGAKAALTAFEDRLRAEAPSQAQVSAA